MPTLSTIWSHGLSGQNMVGCDELDWRLSARDSVLYQAASYDVGVLTHEDGMRQLSKMETQAGIFTMRCAMSVEQVAVHIVDTNTGVSECAVHC
mgnify:CR=1 FL=1